MKGMRLSLAAIVLVMGCASRPAEVKVGVEIAPPHPGRACDGDCNHHFAEGHWYRSCDRHWDLRCGHRYDAHHGLGIWALDTSPTWSKETTKGGLAETTRKDPPKPSVKEPPMPAVAGSGVIATPHPGRPCDATCTHHYWIGYWYASGHRHEEGKCGHGYDEEKGCWTLK